MKLLKKLEELNSKELGVEDGILTLKSINEKSKEISEALGIFLVSALKPYELHEVARSLSKAQEIIKEYFHLDDETDHSSEIHTEIIRSIERALVSTMVVTSNNIKEAKEQIMNYHQLKR